jgi:hypothetical protein
MTCYSFTLLLWVYVREVGNLPIHILYSARHLGTVLLSRRLQLRKGESESILSRQDLGMGRPVYCKFALSHKNLI